jgi:sialidase-1
MLRRLARDVKPAHWGWYATGPGVGIQLQGGAHGGRLIIPCDHGENIDGRRVMLSHVFFSDDHGSSWRLGGTVDRHTDECQLAELDDGSLMINMRNYWGRDGNRPDRDKKRWVATSGDGGESWSSLRFDEVLVEPICQASLIRYRHDGRFGPLLFSNPASTTDRIRMTVRLSRDQGGAWQGSLVLHDGPAAYSCLAVLPDGRIGCLFEAGKESAYETIRFARFSLDAME